MFCSKTSTTWKLGVCESTRADRSASSNAALKEYIVLANTKRVAQNPTAGILLSFQSFKMFVSEGTS